MLVLLFFKPYMIYYIFSFLYMVCFIKIVFNIFYLVFNIKLRKSIFLRIYSVEPVIGSDYKWIVACTLKFNYSSFLLLESLKIKWFKSNHMSNSKRKKEYPCSLVLNTMKAFPLFIESSVPP